MADRLLKTLLIGAERACLIARTCRKEKSLFSLLIEQKEHRYNELDFKTLADVYIQELVRHEVAKSFPNIARNLRGEESNKFTNTVGETILVEVKKSSQETQNLLLKVLDGDNEASRALAECAFKDLEPLDVLPSTEECRKISLSGFSIENAGIWIDPIDCTSEYVKGKENEQANKHNIYEAGLQCCTVLIGVYDITNGRPVMGVVAQPFGEKLNDSGWSTKFYWGFCYAEVKLNNLPTKKKISRNCVRPSCVASVHESKEVLKILSRQCDIVFTRGAGYKMLCVIEQNIDVFIYTGSGTHKWDTCAPHAIILSKGGNMVNYHDVLECVKNGTPFSETLKSKSPVLYGAKETHNIGGIITFMETEDGVSILSDIMNALKYTL